MGFLFRLWWPIYFGLALSIVGITYFIIGATIQGNAEKKAALEAGPPAVIALENFDKSQNLGLAREVVLSLQPDISHVYHLERVKKKKFGGSKSTFATAIFAYGTQSTEPDNPVKAVIVLDGQYENSELIEVLEKMDPKPGPQFPVITVNGTVPTYDKFTKLVKDAITKENMTPSDQLALVEPFLEGREKGLEPQSVLEVGAMGGAFALVLAGYGWFRRSRKKAVE